MVTGNTSFDAASAYGVVLTNSNLTVTSNGTVGAGQGAIGTLSHATGKWYFEVTVTTIDTAVDTWGTSGFGIALATVNYTTFAGSEGTGGVNFYGFNGHISVDGTPSGASIGTVAQGDVIGVAVDMTLGKIWLKPMVGSQVGTNWNGTVGADPTFDVGGITIAPAGAMFPIGVFQFADTNDAMTFNFGGAPFAGIIPTNFTNWSGTLSASVVTVGLPFIPTLTTLPLDLGEPTVAGKRKKITGVTLKVANALGLSMGRTSASAVNLQDLVIGNLGTMTNLPVSGLVTGDVRGILDPLWDVPGQYTIQQLNPFPATILAVVPEIAVGDTQK